MAGPRSHEAPAPNNGTGASPCLLTGGHYISVAGHRCHVADLEAVGNWALLTRQAVYRPVGRGVAYPEDAGGVEREYETAVTFEVSAPVLKKLSADEWQKTAEHEAFDHYSVWIMFRHLLNHEMLHAYRIEELLLKKDWG